MRSEETRERHSAATGRNQANRWMTVMPFAPKGRKLFAVNARMPRKSESVVPSMHVSPEGAKAFCRGRQPPEYVPLNARSPEGARVAYSERGPREADSSRMRPSVAPARALRGRAGPSYSRGSRPRLKTFAPSGLGTLWGRGPGADAPGKMLSALRALRENTLQPGHPDSAKHIRHLER